MLVPTMLLSAALSLTNTGLLVLPQWLLRPQRRGPRFGRDGDSLYRGIGARSRSAVQCRQQCMHRSQLQQREGTAPRRLIRYDYVNSRWSY